MYCTDGIWLGNPRDTHRRVMVKNVTTEVVDRAEINGTTAEKLAVHLLAALFSPEQLARGNVTKPRRDDISQLDATKIRAIQGMVPCIFLNIKVHMHVHVHVQAQI